MREAPESIALIEVPDRDHLRGVAHLTARMGEYLAARARGENGRRSTSEAVRFIPHTPEQRAEFLARTHRRPAPEEKRPQAYTYKRSAALAYQPKKAPAAPAAGIPAVSPVVGGNQTASRGSVSGTGPAARKRRAEQRSRPVGSPNRESGPSSPNVTGGPRRTKPKPVKGRRSTFRQGPLRPDFQNLGEVILQQLGLA
jgi:hypothetical protein